MRTLWCQVIRKLKASLVLEANSVSTASWARGWLKPTLGSVSSSQEKGAWGCSCKCNSIFPSMMLLTVLESHILLTKSRQRFRSEQSIILWKRTQLPWNLIYGKERVSKTTSNNGWCNGYYAPEIAMETLIFFWKHDSHKETTTPKGFSDIHMAPSSSIIINIIVGITSEFLA